MIVKGGNIEDLPMWAQIHIKQQQKEIDGLKRTLGKIYTHSEAIVQVFSKLNVGARND